MKKTLLPFLTFLLLLGFSSLAAAGTSPSAGGDAAFIASLAAPPQVDQAAPSAPPGPSAASTNAPSAKAPTDDALQTLQAAPKAAAVGPCCTACIGTVVNCIFACGSNIICENVCVVAYAACGAECLLAGETCPVI